MTPPCGGASPEVPEGYEQAATDGGSASLEPETCNPLGYKKARAPKRDEHNRRPPRHAGQKKVCQGCYRSGYTIHDLICKRCLRERHELALVEREIAKHYPRTSTMSSGRIMQQLWNYHKASLANIRRLKLELQQKKDDISEITTGRVGVR